MVLETVIQNPHHAVDTHTEPMVQYVQYHNSDPTEQGREWVQAACYLSTQQPGEQNGICTVAYQAFRAILYHWNKWGTHITSKQTIDLTGNSMSALFIRMNGHTYRAFPKTTRKLVWNSKFSQRWSFRLWFSEIWCHVILCRDVPHFQHNGFAWNDGIYLLTNTASYSLNKPVILNWPPWTCPYFDIVVGLVWPNDSES